MHTFLFHQETWLFSFSLLSPNKCFGHWNNHTAHKVVSPLPGVFLTAPKDLENLGLQNTIFFHKHISLPYFFLPQIGFLYFSISLNKFHLKSREAMCCCWHLGCVSWDLVSNLQTGVPGGDCKISVFSSKPLGFKSNDSGRKSRKSLQI